MKNINKSLSALIAASLIFSLCMPIASMAEEPVLSYSFTEGTGAGIADGTITLSGLSDIKDSITNINMYWGSDSSIALSDYANIRSYVSGYSNTWNYYDKSGLDYTDDNSLVYEISGSRLIPENAKYIIAEIVTSDGTAKTVSTSIPAEKLNNYGEPAYTMFWISDTHASYASVASGSNINKAFADMQEIAAEDGDKFKGTIVNGDIANSAYDYEYAAMENAIDKYSTGLPVYYNTGNHDTQASLNGGRTDEALKAMETRFSKLKNEYGLEFDREDTWSYDTYIEGQHYIFLSLPYYSSYTLSDDQAKWLEEKICEGERSGMPTYIFSHVPYPNTVAMSEDNGFYESSDSKKFAEILERHPSAIVVTSHIHLELDNDQKTVAVNNVIDGFTAEISFVDTSSAYNTYVSGLSGNKGNAYGRYVQIYKDKVVVKARNFKTQQWVPRSEYVVPIDTSKPFEGNVTITGWETDSIPSGAVLSAKLNGEAVNTEEYTYTWYVDGVNVGADADYTVEAENKNVAVKVVDRDTGAYAYAITDYREPVSDDGDDAGTEIVYDNTAQVKYYKDIVNVSGQLDSTYAGEKAVLMLIPKTSYTDIATAEYLNECTIASDGSYTFKFKADAANLDEEYMLIVKLESGEAEKNIVIERTSEPLVQMSAVYDSAAGKVNVSVKNDFLDVTETQLLTASYLLGGRFKDVTLKPFTIQFGENGETQTTEIEAAEPGDYLKTMLWSDLTNITPIADGYIIDITQE